jgi:hypothetical protein
MKTSTLINLKLIIVTNFELLVNFIITTLFVIVVVIIHNQMAIILILIGKNIVKNVHIDERFEVNIISKDL